MDLIRETEWRTFEEVLALALGWSIEDARERAKEYDAASGEKPYEYPDPVDEFFANGDLATLAPYEGPLDLPEAASKEPSSGDSTSGIPKSAISEYRHVKQLLRQAIANKDIAYVGPPAGVEDALEETVLNPAHVSRWLNAMRLRDIGKLAERIVSLEKENAALKREIERRNKHRDDITARYLKIAIQEYYAVWHARDEALALPDQASLLEQFEKKYGLSRIAAQAIEKVICPIERNRAKTSKA